MFLRFRPVQSEDLRLCFENARNRFAFPTDEDRADLLRMWHTLLGDGRMIGAVMEDVSAPADKRIAWHCFKVFATDTFTESLKCDGAAPLPSRQLLDFYRQGACLPILTATQIRQANGGVGNGLNMLITHYGSPYAIQADNPLWHEVASCLLDFTDYFSSGYRTREILEEFYDGYNTALAQNAGFSPRNDFRAYYKDREQPRAEETPNLQGATAAEAALLPGTIAATVFHYQTPQFCFKPGEQEMLLQALLGETDEEIAAQLNLAEVSIRKRWGAIYDRVVDVEPAFFPGCDNHLSSRGPEKKRYLLSYLRRHLSELRPLETSSAKRTTGLLAPM